MGSASDMAPEFGLLGWQSVEQAQGGAYEIEVRSGGAGALRYDAELWVLRDEGSKDERLIRVPLHIGAGTPVQRFAFRNNQVEAE